MRGSTAQRGRPSRPAALRGRARLVHGAFRAHADDDAPRTRSFTPRPTATSNPPASCSRSTPLPACPSDGCCARRSRGTRRDGESGIAERLKIGWVPDREPRHPQSPGQGGRDGLGPGTRKTSSPCSTPSSARFGRRSRSASSMPSAPRSREQSRRGDRGRGPHAFRGRTHRVRIQGQEPVAPLRALGAQRGPLGPSRASQTAFYFPTRRRWRSPNARGWTLKSS